MKYCGSMEVILRLDVEDIIKSLQSIEQQGYFYGLQRSNLDDFSLEIKGIGEVKWPLSVSMANKLIRMR